MRILPILMLFIVFSCKENSETNQSNSNQVDLDETPVKATILQNNQKEDDTITKIQFKELSLSINRFVVYDEESKLNEIQKDTVNLYAELGETIEGQKITISSDEITDITVEQRYETSLTIGTEGESFDLADWKHYNSEWKVIKAINLGEFICDKYSLEDSEKFPKIKIEKIKERFKIECPNCDSLISEIKSIKQSPVEVVISRYFLKIKGKRKDNGESITKIIIIQVPMSC